MKYTVFSAFFCFLLFAAVGCSNSHVMTGKASYYGDKFQGRFTKSGEVFDKNKLTAAHKTWPMGSRVRVTNLENDRQVVVRINDHFRGTKGRIIDLSEAAFKRLAPLERGVIPVRLERLEKE